jgi:chromosome segregation ATPase
MQASEQELDVRESQLSTRLPEELRQIQKFRDYTTGLKRKYDQKIEQLVQDSQIYEESHADLSNRLKQTITQLQRLKNEHDAAVFALSRSKEEIVEMEEEIASLREQQIQVKQLYDHSQTEIRRQIEEIEHHKQKEVQLERALGFLRQRQEELELEVNELTQALEASHQELAQGNLAKEQISTQAEQVHKIEKELQEAKEEILRLEEKSKEQSQLLGRAEKHLARKVKETALMQERFEEQKGINGSSQHQIEQLRQESAHLQTRLDQESQEREMMKEQLIAWEDKAADWNQKMIDAESKIQELKWVEERYNQLQSLITNLSVAATPQQKKEEG